MDDTDQEEWGMRSKGLITEDGEGVSHVALMRVRGMSERAVWERKGMEIEFLAVYGETES